MSDAPFDGPSDLPDDRVPPDADAVSEGADPRLDALVDMPADTRVTAADMMRRSAPALGPDIDATLAFAALLDRLAAGDADDRLADLAAAQASGAPTSTDRALLIRLGARMASDAPLRDRFGAFADTAARLHAHRPDPAAHFAALVSAASGAIASAGPVTRLETVGDEARASERRPHVRAADRAPTGRVRESRPRWRVGVVAGVAVLAVAFAGLRLALPPRLDLGEAARPEPSRSAVARPDTPRAAYVRAAAALDGAERTVWGVSLGLDRARVAAARAALDSVVAATPAASALHLDARFLRGVACEATGDVACARREFRAVVDGKGSRTSEAIARLARFPQ